MPTTIPTPPARRRLSSADRASARLQVLQPQEGIEQGEHVIRGILDPPMPIWPAAECEIGEIVEEAIQHCHAGSLAVGDEQKGAADVSGIGVDGLGDAVAADADDDEPAASRQPAHVSSEFGRL